jgi:periplasmic divalent cation tolerance protein
MTLEKKMAACVNIFPGIISVYSWKEKIEHEEEHAIIFKTTID